MIPQKLIQYAAVVALAFAAVGQLPRLVKYSRIQTLKVLKGSQSSNWGKVWAPKSAPFKRKN